MSGELGLLSQQTQAGAHPELLESPLPVDSKTALSKEGKCNISAQPAIYDNLWARGLEPEVGTLFGGPAAILCTRTRERKKDERGLFTGGISRISKISTFSRISRKWSDSPLFSTVWGSSKISRISKFSRISRKWTFLKRPLFQKTPFSEPEERL